MKFSIISTVYNKESFLIDHIESLINQDYKNIEIIFVNDGSTDNSLQILEHYENKFKKIKVINQENQGASIARKNGFIASKGDLVYFVDSDDLLYENNTISKIVKRFEENSNIDVLFGQMLNSYNNSLVLDKVIYCPNIKEGVHNIDYLYDKSFRLGLTNKIMKKEILDEKDFINHKYYEDGIVSYNALSRAKYFYYLNEPIYVINRKSINNKRISSTVDVKNFINKYESLKEIEKNTLFEISIKRLYLQCYLDDLYVALDLKYSDKKKMLQKTNEIFDEKNFDSKCLISNKHYKNLYKYRFLYSNTFTNYLIQILINVKKGIKLIMKLMIKIFKKALFFIPNKITALSKKIKILSYKVKYGNQLSIGKNISFRKGFVINISKDGHLKIGDNNFFNNYCSINCQNQIILGNDNIFGENVKIYDHDHIFNDLKKDMKKEFNNGKISIGNNNWVGTNTVILRNTTLYDHNVVGASTILKGNYESNKLIKSNRENIVEDIKYKE